MRGLFEGRTAFCLALGAVLAARAAGAAPPEAAAPPDTSTSPTVSPPAAEIPPDLRVRVVVETFGEFVIRLDRERDPNAASLFLTLAASSAFDGLTFHRVIPGLLVQTGDPATRDEDAENDGVSAPPWRLPAATTPRAHHRGTVSLAWRGSDPASAGMQWFVALSEVPALDGRARPIGDVVEGMDVVDRIAQVSTFRDRRPLRAVRIQAARVEPPAQTSATAPPSAPRPAGSK